MDHLYLFWILNRFIADNTDGAYAQQLQLAYICETAINLHTQLAILCYEFYFM